jgi:hypothetical protein
MIGWFAFMTSMLKREEVRTQIRSRVDCNLVSAPVVRGDLFGPEHIPPLETVKMRSALKPKGFLTDVLFHLKSLNMKKRRYADLYGYTSDEFDRWLERGINNRLRSVGKCRSELDMHTVFAAYKDETRKLPRRRLRQMRITP